MNSGLYLFVLLGIVCAKALDPEYKPCAKQPDCNADECCISKNRPIGKRTVVPGYCLPLGNDNSFCYVRYGSASHPPDHLVFGCPCTKPLLCKGNGTYDIPLGETGFCTHKLLRRDEELFKINKV